MLELVLVRSKVLVLELVRSKVLELVLARSKVLELAQVHSKVPELVRSKLAQEHCKTKLVLPSASRTIRHHRSPS
ncbi:MAG: hypothetical protein HKN47_26195 [Pirellulaceae bacterium]|nr:hypothetical protein [Pirellulaceae bacterium]